MYDRYLPIKDMVKHKSILLLGPRQTGKSTLLKNQFPEARYIDLLEADTFRELSAYPEIMRQRLQENETLIIIDEIQKLPGLLDEVQLLIDRNKKLRFILTGSSARKLKRGRANLLAGRMWTTHLHPLVSPETKFSKLTQRLNFGGLPGILDSNLPREDLKSYVGTYLQEEIQAEGFTRSIEKFSRFLQVAGSSNGQQINYSSIGNDCGVNARTVKDHFQILEDTLIAFRLPTYKKTKKRKPVSMPKLYFFDLGVANVLKSEGDIKEGSAAFGYSLEHLIFLELKAYLDYTRSDYDLTYWRTRTQLEVDYIIGDKCAIEVKAKKHIRISDVRGLLALEQDVKKIKKIVVCLEKEKRVLDSVEIIPCEEFFRKLWGGELF